MVWLRKTKICWKADLCYINTDSFIVYINIDHIYKTLLNVLKQGLILQIMSCKDHYQKEKNKKIIGLMKNESGGKTAKEFVWLRAKTYSHLTDKKRYESKKHKRVYQEKENLNLKIIKVV